LKEAQPGAGWLRPENADGWNPRRVLLGSATAWVGRILFLAILITTVAVPASAADSLPFVGDIKTYILNVAEKRFSDIIGAPVQAQNFKVNIVGTTPEIDLYGVTIQGSPPHTNTPLLHVDHVHLVIKITSLLRLTWYLQDLEADHPVVHVFIDAQGRTNLPKQSNGAQSSSSNVFDFGVRHAIFKNGEVYYNNRKSPLNADVHNLTLFASYNTVQKSYSGTLSYTKGVVDVSGIKPIDHNLTANFTASPSGLEIQRALVESGPSSVILTAFLRDYSQPQLQGNYQATVDTGQFRQLLRNSSLPRGVVTSSGTIRYASAPNRPFLEAIIVNGALSSRALNVAQLKGRVTNLAAHYSIANGNLEMHDLRGRLLGGEVTGTVTMLNLAGITRSQVTATLRGLSLSDMMPFVTTQPMHEVSLRGTVNGQTSASWRKSISNMVATADATIAANVAPNNGNPGAVPVNGRIHARYVAATKQITLTDSVLHMPQTSVFLNGTVSGRSSLAVRVNSSDLHELEGVANLFRTPTPGHPARPLGLYGAGSFVGSVRGSLSAPQVVGQVQATNLRVKNTEWRKLATNVSLSPSGISLHNGELYGVPRGRVTFDISLGLQKWAFTETSPIQAVLNASQLDITNIARAAGSPAQVSGILNGNIDVHGSELNPIGHGKLSLAQATIAQQPIRTLDVDFNGDGNAVLAQIAAQLPAGAATATGTYYPRTQAYEARLEATGVQLSALQPVKERKLPIQGTANVAATGSGTIHNPGVNATVQIPQLDLSGQKITAIVLRAAVANHASTFTLESSAVGTRISGEGRVDLTGDYQSNITLDTQRIPLGPLIAAYLPSQEGDVQGETEVHAKIWGPLKKPPQLHAQATIPVLSLQYQNKLQIGAAQPIQVDYVAGMLQVQRAQLRGTDTNLTVEGAIPIKSSAPGNFLVLGTVDLRLAQLINPNITSSGQLRVNINTSAQAGNPNVEGVIHVVNASFTTSTIPVGLQNGNGVLTLTRNRLDVTDFHGTVAGGQFTASGGVVYKPALRFDLALAGRGMRVLYNNVRAGLDSDLTLTGTRNAARLGGQVRIDSLQLTPGFELTDLTGQIGPGVAPPPSPGGFSQNLQLNVNVASTSGINAVSRTLSVQGAANLRVTGTVAQPVVLGRMTVSSGDVIFNSNRYELQSGTVDFVNPARTEPVLNIAANTTVQQYNIQVRLYGPVENLHTNFTSDPSLPPSDIINLLVGFKTAEASAASPAAPGNLAAEQLIASQVASQLTGRVERIAGISQLSIDPVLRPVGGLTPGAVITVQQRVTSKIFVTFQTDVTSAQNQVIKLAYRKSRRLSFNTTRDQNGGFGFDARLHKEW
jgi:translocation and assembly module TamB